MSRRRLSNDECKTVGKNEPQNERMDNRMTKKLEHK